MMFRMVRWTFVWNHYFARNPRQPVNSRMLGSVSGDEVCCGIFVVVE